ncbi:RagB/SusD family nutrient uptake outer membrane protein [Flavobacterium sp. LC2016-12]|uniref:RagB/SusD family nutrient uptake outer membrane protein n=1 Tax=Flavobacterium sp. LC2016-12 TaxID=2783794 RepID=UPI00188C930F|nr:RagB/SusD family nutrient uptake outer membrane protein [Flavobacterium sp. LC2016-12]MBF4464980.1 RagB/SusD family nutrient uptake outer membrane protein [Flavobacterium sp. LC2016-12]
MKSRILHIKSILFLVMILGFVSCEEEFLEINPKGRIILETTADYNLALSNQNLINIDYGFGVSASQVIMGDEIVAYKPYFDGTTLRHQRFFRYEGDVYQPDEDAMEMGSLMTNIYAYNVIINGVLSSTQGTDQQKRSLQAEAMSGRAWTYFLLINYYGKPYNDATAATDPGYPIVTDADVTLTAFNRGSVQQVYDFIIKDLTDAIPSLPTESTSRIRMTKAAAEGILGKVYVFMGRFDQALPHLNASIAGLSSGSIPLGLHNYNQTFASDGEFQPITIFGPTYPILPNDKEIVFGKQFVNSNTFFNNEFVLSPSAAALFGSSDLRLNFYSPSAFFAEDYPIGMLRRVSPSNTQIGVIIPDLYLLRAECKARLNDLAGAVTDVETLRKNRMPLADMAVPSDAAGSQQPLVKFILEERIREFAVQGYRWFDMRRLSVDPVYKQTINFTHTLYDADGSVSETYPLSEDRLVLKFPQKVINQNPGMENNP